MKRLSHMLPAGIHYAWIVVALVFTTLLAAAAVRSAPSVLIVPLEQAFGWSPATISFAISLNLVLYGCMGPFAAALMQRFGIRPTLVGALCVVDLGVILSSFVSQPWHLVVCWGLLVGIGAGTVAPVLGATVVNRWFTARRGLAMGIVTAASATGQLLFLPTLASIAQSDGWRQAVYVVAAVLALVIPIVAFLLPERPETIGLRTFGETGPSTAPAKPPANPLVVAVNALGRASQSRDFWIFGTSFFVCGASANGLVGTHLVAFCIDHGIPEVRAAWLLAAMGAFNIVGTTCSGWLSDRYDNRVLLMCYFGLRGLSLIYLPYSRFDLETLSVFAVFYGLDWLATVPPMMRLLTEAFGKADAPVIFGWIFAGHQLGAGSIALLAGALRSDLGSYFIPFFLSGIMCLVIAVLVLRIGTGRLALAGAE
ncbi:MAG TPA: MFS transporter [Stellaceae bacterium]|nr:MFS transporter [Stellaceae bacterium]